MRKAFIVAVVGTVVAICGCATNGDLMKVVATSSRSDVFQELSDGGIPPRGYADVRVVSSFKLHGPSRYAFERSSHGTPDYQLLLNIDGQVVKLKGNLSEEKLEPRWTRDPEAGEGIRYGFTRDLRVKAGVHTVTVAQTDDGIVMQKKISFEEGTRNSLVLEPIYGASREKQQPGLYGCTSFYEGIKGFRMVLNGKPL